MTEDMRDYLATVTWLLQGAALEGEEEAPDTERYVREQGLDVEVQKD